MISKLFVFGIASTFAWSAPIPQSIGLITQHTRIKHPNEISIFLKGQNRVGLSAAVASLHSPSQDHVIYALETGPEILIVSEDPKLYATRIFADGRLETLPLSDTVHGCIVKDFDKDPHWAHLIAMRDLTNQTAEGIRRHGFIFNERLLDGYEPVRRRAHDGLPPNLSVWGGRLLPFEMPPPQAESISDGEALEFARGAPGIKPDSLREMLARIKIVDGRGPSDVYNSLAEFFPGYFQSKFVLQQPINPLEAMDLASLFMLVGSFGVNRTLGIQFRDWMIETYLYYFSNYLSRRQLGLLTSHIATPGEGVYSARSITNRIHDHEKFPPPPPWQ